MASFKIPAKASLTGQCPRAWLWGSGEDGKRTFEKGSFGLVSSLDSLLPWQTSYFQPDWKFTNRNAPALKFLLHWERAALDLIQSPWATLTTKWGKFGCLIISFWTIHFSHAPDYSIRMVPSSVVNKLLLSAYYVQRRELSIWFEFVPVLGSRMVLIQGREAGQLITPGPWGKLHTLSFLIRKMGMNLLHRVVRRIEWEVPSMTSSKHSVHVSYCYY